MTRCLHAKSGINHRSQEGLEVKRLLNDASYQRRRAMLPKNDSWMERNDCYGLRGCRQQRTVVDVCLLWQILAATASVLWTVIPVRLRRDAGQASEVTPELTRAAIPNFSRDFFHGQHGIDKEACRGVDAAAVDMRSEP